MSFELNIPKATIPLINISAMQLLNIITEMAQSEDALSCLFRQLTEMQNHATYTIDGKLLDKKENALQLMLQQKRLALSKRHGFDLSQTTWADDPLDGSSSNATNLNARDALIHQIRQEEITKNKANLQLIMVFLHFVVVYLSTYVPSYHRLVVGAVCANYAIVPIVNKLVALFLYMKLTICKGKQKDTMTSDGLSPFDESYEKIILSEHNTFNIASRNALIGSMFKFSIVMVTIITIYWMALDANKDSGNTINNNNNQNNQNDDQKTKTQKPDFSYIRL